MSRIVQRVRTIGRWALAAPAGWLALAGLAGCLTSCMNPPPAAVPPRSPAPAVPAAAPVAPTVASAAVLRVVHPPYAARECSSCHENKMSQKLGQPMPKLCFSCHDDFLKSAAVKHAPAEAGECLSCHHPHFGDRPKRLLRDGDALCFECHDRQEVRTSRKQHADPPARACLDCHQPHSSDRKGLLRPAYREDA